VLKERWTWTLSGGLAETEDLDKGVGDNRNVARKARIPVQNYSLQLETKCSITRNDTPKSTSAV
jgi:hypothetical protein